MLYGGDQAEAAYGVATDASGNVFITGETSSSNLPVLPVATSVSAGQVDAFAAKLSPTGALLYSRYIGGSQVDRARGVAVDSAGQAYITGRTDSGNFPLVAPFQAVKRGGMDAFVTKINATGAALVYSSYLGGSLGSDIFPEEGAAIAVDSAGRAFVSGSTPSDDFPLSNAAQLSYGGGSLDGFVASVSPTGQSLLFSTFMGGAALDYGTGVNLDTSGNAHFAGYSASLDFPSVSASFGPAGGYDAIAGSSQLRAP